MLPVMNASLLVGVEAALDSVRAELGAYTPALTLAAAWAGGATAQRRRRAVRIVSADDAVDLVRVRQRGARRGRARL